MKNKKTTLEKKNLNLKVVEHTNIERICGAGEEE